MNKKHIIIALASMLIIFIFQGCIELQKRTGGGYPFSKPYTIKSEYSKNQRVYLQVYCEDTFYFQKEGVCIGSFMLSSLTDFDALRIQIIIPKFDAFSPEYDSRYRAHLSLPCKIEFEWKGKDGSIHNTVSTAYPENEIYDGTTYCGYIGFCYVPLPRNKTIDYILSYDKGKYIELEEINGKIREDKKEDIRKYPEKYPDFWNGKFMVVEGYRKGKVMYHQKEAKD